MPGPWHVTAPASFEGMSLPESEEMGTEREVEDDLDWVSVNMDDSCLIMVLWKVSMVMDEDSLRCI